MTATSNIIRWILVFFGITASIMFIVIGWQTVLLRNSTGQSWLVPATFVFGVGIFSLASVTLNIFSPSYFSTHIYQRRWGTLVIFSASLNDVFAIYPHSGFSKELFGSIFTTLLLCAFIASALFFPASHQKTKKK